MQRIFQEMREIKFRGKRSGGEWIYGGFTYRFNHHRCIVVFAPIEQPDNQNCYEDNWDVYVDVMEDTIGQYTGLKDCNGKEIYEGDIFTVKGLYPRVVVWDKVGWALMPCEYYYDEHFWIMNIQHPGEDWWELFSKEIEVVGNIFDNPEMLKGGEQ